MENKEKDNTFEFIFATFAITSIMWCCLFGYIIGVTTRDFDAKLKKCIENNRLNKQ